MKPITPINSKRFLGRYYYYQPNTTVPEWLDFLAGVVLTVALPPLLFVLPYGESSPLLLLTIETTIGVPIGIHWFLNPAKPIRLFPPMDITPELPTVANANKPKQAA
jgi:hypothetical protein